MIVLERESSNKMIMLEILMRRLDEEDMDYEYFRNQYKTIKYGYEGEMHVDREWEEIIIPSKYYLFHNFETENEVKHSHQIDTIFASQNFILLLEIKNIGGRINFDQKKHQFMRTRLDGTKDGYSNPVNQIERHVRFFKRIFMKWEIALPIEYAIILTQPSTVIGDTPNNAAIFHVSGLQTYVYNLFAKYQKNQISPHKLEILKNYLLAIRKRKIWDPKIDKNKLRKGVLCKACNYKSVMRFEHGNFICPMCKAKNKDALYEALYDYRHLHSEWITNYDLRNYLNIGSRFAVKRLVSNLNLEYEGIRKDRKYRIPDNILTFIEKRT
ncbi:nuclease-related domain-containing protein [Lysinibacillus telephonicus]|uniref:nuclease-related domain-containing protein n=1 Tax=Lysinibacillus telephonicus TaxID=1714840 RepID=UPI0031FD588D